MSLHIMRPAAAGLLLACLALPALGGEGERLARESCAGCHRIDAPDPASLTLEERITRKAPPLHYAGHKYRQEWLQAWLQAPEPVTPAGGGFWADSVEVTVEGDEVDDSTLKPHLALDEAEAAAVSDYLMSLKPYPELIRPGEYTPGKVPRMLAEKDFRKFKGCVACHRDAADFGGVTGPELYTAMQRLQPEFIASYIRDPLAWEPRSLMPRLGLNDEPIYKLINYLMLLSEENAE